MPVPVYRSTSREYTQIQSAGLPITQFTSQGKIQNKRIVIADSYSAGGKCEEENTNAKNTRKKTGYELQGAS